MWRNERLLGMVRLWESRAGGEGLEGLDLDHMKNLGNIGFNSHFISEEMMSLIIISEKLFARISS